MASADEEFIKQLREVFDLCDELKCGIISVNQLRDIVRKHFGGSEEVSLLIILTMKFHYFVHMTIIGKSINKNKTFRDVSTVYTLFTDFAFCQNQLLQHLEKLCLL